LRVMFKVFKTKNVPATINKSITANTPKVKDSVSIVLFSIILKNSFYSKHNIKKELGKAKLKFKFM